MTVFNDALLRRQAWRLINGDDSLLGRTMEAKYYPNSSFLEASMGYSCSYVWGAKALVKEGVMWHVGNGLNINIWKDQWLTDDEGRFITSNKVDVVSRVSELINFQTMEWDEEIIFKLFNERDQHRIMSILISWRAPNDTFTWAYTKHGNYSVKTTYMLGKGCNFDTFHVVWTEIWNMDVSPKVKHFLWRLCTGTLPTRAVLKSRHLLKDAGCPWCSREEETAMHTLFHCERVKELWIRSDCEELLNNLNSYSLTNMIADWKGVDPKMKQRATYLTWCIWQERNQKIFEDKTTPNNILLSRVSGFVEEYEKYNLKIYHSVKRHKSTSLNVWHAPPDGVIKINADASLSEAGWMNLGAIGRNNEGKVLFAATRRVKAYWPPKIAEGKALVMAARLGKKNMDIKILSLNQTVKL